LTHLILYRLASSPLTLESCGIQIISQQFFLCVVKRHGESIYELELGCKGVEEEEGSETIYPKTA
tara:strand:+ start:61 stop:255 length:195 start_codon:yes stop_codon:yes gene_type:complete